MGKYYGQVELDNLNVPKNKYDDQKSFGIFYFDLYEKF
jgi:hypothetical protein